MQKRKVRNAYLFISSLLVGLFSFPFAFAKSVEKRASQFKNTVSNLSVNDFVPTIPSAVSVYDSLRLNLAGLNRAAFEMAQKGFEKLREQGVILNDSIVSIIDFSLPSTDKRLYVVDLKNYQVLYNTYVAHGRNSGKETANSFSNSPSSNKSSLGFYKTLGTYIGKHGYSLKLEGLEKGINDNAYNRAIVMHGANYVNPDYIPRLGYIGRSQGCPAVAPREATPIINTIKDGSCLFIYSPNTAYQEHSPILS
ncbi:MAG TPA: murein L,D-transpeptidase catalytic domain family protein [Chitinophagaceae bacterium]|nr:murein L,D-transpeptidase catalytic domain family protein [Chitinophagaceae bacterium]